MERFTDSKSFISSRSSSSKYGGCYDGQNTTVPRISCSDIVNESIESNSSIDLESSFSYKCIHENFYPDYVVFNSFIPPRETIKLWDLIGKFIKKRLQFGQGVVLPELGILTLNSRTFNLSQELKEQNLNPAFVLNSKFAQRHRLKSSPHLTSNDIRNVSLNFSTLAQLLGLERDRVQMTFTETVEKINTMLRAGHKVVLPFREIGELVLCLESVKMNFCTDFLRPYKKRKIINIKDKAKIRCYR